MGSQSARSADTVVFLLNLNWGRGKDDFGCAEFQESQDSM